MEINVHVLEILEDGYTHGGERLGFITCVESIYGNLYVYGSERCA